MDLINVVTGQGSPIVFVQGSGSFCKAMLAKICDLLPLALVVVTRKDEVLNWTGTIEDTLVNHCEVGGTLAATSNDKAFNPALSSLMSSELESEPPSLLMTITNRTISAVRAGWFLTPTVRKSSALHMTLTAECQHLGAPK